MGELVDGVEDKESGVDEFIIEVIEHNTTRCFYDDGSVEEAGDECHSYFITMEEVLEFLVEDVKVGIVGVTILGEPDTEYWEEFGQVREECFVERVEILPLFGGRPIVSYNTVGEMVEEFLSK